MALVTAAPPLTGRAQDLTVESAVTSLPSLIGTSPSGLAWSPDGSQLAFLWNDEGMPFRDVWIVSAEGWGTAANYRSKRGRPAAGRRFRLHGSFETRPPVPYPGRRFAGGLDSRWRKTDLRL